MFQNFALKYKGFFYRSLVCEKEECSSRQLLCYAISCKYLFLYWCFVSKHAECFQECKAHFTIKTKIFEGTCQEFHALILALSKLHFSEVLYNKCRGTYTQNSLHIFLCSHSFAAPHYRLIFYLSFQQCKKAVFVKLLTMHLCTAYQYHILHWLSSHSTMDYFIDHKNEYLATYNERDRTHQNYTF